MIAKAVSFNVYGDERVVGIVARAARQVVIMFKRQHLGLHEVLGGARQGRSGVMRKFFRNCRNNMGNEPILALPEGSENFVVLGRAKLARLYVDEAVARHGVHVSSIPDKDGMYIEALERDVEVCLFENLVVIGILTFREAEIGEGKMFGLELELETTKVVVIKERLEEAKDRQKSYADNSRKPLEFEVGNRELLKVTPWKGVVHFGKKGKLVPRCVEPFEILERIGPVVYRLRLPEELSGVHDTFHVSNLKKCLADASLHMPLDEIKIDKTFRFVEEPVENSDREVMRLKCSGMVIVKVRFWLEVRSLGLQFLFDELRGRVINDVVTQLKVFDEFPR
ncbi:hypothetical protein Tco_0975290 [Tanacetum coccineum]|uniref:Tf2-1-like SH3-like domain-containing protein n=1 Tax=Tanacetum coccineum TaxID=301880 RepID=A0ABQ5EEA3_9ASTR